LKVVSFFSPDQATALEEGDHHGIAVHDGMGEVLTGIRLELKLGMQVAD
jgi:hypothetical protein